MIISSHRTMATMMTVRAQLLLHKHEILRVFSLRVLLRNFRVLLNRIITSPKCHCLAPHLGSLLIRQLAPSQYLSLLLPPLSGCLVNSISAFEHTQYPLLVRRRSEVLHAYFINTAAHRGDLPPLALARPLCPPPRHHPSGRPQCLPIHLLDSYIT